MWILFRLFLYIPNTRAGTLRLEWCKSNQFYTQVEEQGPPAMNTLTTCLLFTRFYTYVAQDPMERIGRVSCPDSFLPLSFVSVTEHPA